MKNLVIVESPAKAKTISKYLGKDYEVMSSIGHIRAIPKKGKNGEKAIDVNNGFKTLYEVDPPKRKTVSELKKAVKAADQVWLATDEDREGEAIAWHLVEVLKLDPKTTKRITFNEITKAAIEEAIKNPRTIDMNLVQAQQARQILDRLVGFELSPVVWQKVPGGKSAGRVQSPAVRLVVEREEEIINFKPTFDFKVTAELSHQNNIFQAELSKRIKTISEAEDFLQKTNTATLTVDAVEKKPTERNPQAPFTTSTLQQTANAKLGFSSKQTMVSAQRLYQAGKITYMRTDSVNLSNMFLKFAHDYIDDTFGTNYSKVRKFRTKSANAQEAHEAIRPTDIRVEKASSNTTDQKLYNLIRQRTLASQMAPAKLEKTVLTIKNNQDERHFTATGEIVTFDGFLKAYGRFDAGNELPKLKAGDKLDLISVTARQTFKKAPARYTEGSLVKKLEELGIGRPSTYATIIDTIQTRGYVEKGDSDGEEREIIVIKLEKGTVSQLIETDKYGATKGKLVATAVGKMISDFLLNHFNQVVDYDFTATIEEDFDEIARGELERNRMLTDFYKPFHKLVMEAKDIKRSEVSNARLVGEHPKEKKPIYARLGRFGPMLQLGETNNSEKPRFAPIPKDTQIETVTLEQAIEAFKLPRLVGQTKDGKEIKANIGRFGPYIQVDKLFVSIKPLDPMTITLKEALELYEKKIQAEKDKNIAQWGKIKIIRGPYGPYVTDGKTNARIPKKQDPTKITEEQAKQILEERVKKPTRRRAGKKSTKPTKK
ncbi:MAG: type I DNA topoisomerase [Candidatus Nanosyncoccaceae bacterium]|jgi:DNA topoisomerase-1